VSNDEQRSAALRELFEHDGYSISTTWSGRDALAELQSEHFDGVMVDDYVPDLYVGQFIERASQIPFHPRVIVVRAHQSRDEVRHFGAPGTFWLIEKAGPAEMGKAAESALHQGNSGRMIEGRVGGNGTGH